MPKLRQNIVTGEWVVIAPERAKRPEDFVSAAQPKRVVQLGKTCEFCLSSLAYQKFRIKEADTENIYIVPNKFPAFVDQDAVIIENHGFYSSTKSTGGHEVIVMKDHDKDFPNINPLEVAELFEVYKDRYIHYNHDPVIEYVMAIHNHGPEAGMSIEHAHSQLFAPSIMPNYPKKELEGSLAYYLRTGHCVFCDILAEEHHDGRRILAENEDFLAFTFFASRFPFEMWVVPKKHQGHFEQITKVELESLGEILLGALSMLYSALKDPPFNYFIHNGPAHRNHIDRYYHWHLEIAPRVSKFGGFEIGSGMIIDVVSPERAAEFLKKAETRTPQLVR